MYAVLIGTLTPPSRTAPNCAITASDEFSTRVATRSPFVEPVRPHRVREPVGRAEQRARGPLLTVDVEELAVGIGFEARLDQVGHRPRVAVDPDSRRHHSPLHKAEERTDLVDEDLGLLEGGEVPAAIGLVEVPKVGEPPLDPTPRRPEDLLREDRAPERDRDRFGVGLVEALPVEPRRRRAVGRAASRASRCRAARHARARSRDGRRNRSSPRTSRRPTRTGRRASRRARSRASAAGTPAGWSTPSPTGA